MIKKIRWGLIATAMFAGLGQADAQVLYAVDGASGNASTLYSLDAATGAIVSTIGATGFNHVTGLAVHPLTGEIYGFSSGPSAQGVSGTGQLLAIDPTTGAATAIGAPSDRRISDIGFDPAGTLFGWCQKDCGGQSAPKDLVILDLADGTETIVGDSGLSTGQTGLAFDSAGNLFINIINSLNEIDPLTGQSTGFVNISTPAGQDLDLYNSLAFDPTDTLYGISRDIDAVGGLLTIDQLTSTATFLGNSGIQHLSAIAFGMVTSAAVPEPGSLALYGTGLIGLVALRRRRAK